MPGEFSDTGSGYALDIVTGRAAGPGVRTTYLALLTATPTDSTTMGTLAELTTSGYARQSVTWSAPANLSSVPETHNSGVLTFGPFTADPPNAVACALVSASSGTTGDLLFYWTLDVAKDAATGESIQFAASALSVGLD